jgi:hypothetical protein
MRVVASVGPLIPAGYRRGPRWDCCRNRNVDLNNRRWDRPDLDCEPQQTRGILRNLQVDETTAYTSGKITSTPRSSTPRPRRSCPDGEEGELVFTSLTKQAFPVVRYRTQDLTALLPGTARSMRRMHKITGRSDDMIILRGVNLFQLRSRN